MQDLKPLQMFLILSLLFVLLSCPAASASDGIHLELTHVDAGLNLTKLELIQRMAIRTNNRAVTLFSKSVKSANPIAPPVRPGNGDVPYDREYLMSLSIGTPPQLVRLTVDTGSDLIWTQCQPCLQCFDQPLPLYNPSNSSTFENFPCLSKLCQTLPFSACHQQCFYLYEYGDGSVTVGSLSSETFTFGSERKVAVPNLGFGCGFLNGGVFVSNESGIAGLGRGPSSLTSQLGLGKFSYCLTSLFGSKSSPLMFGPPAELYNKSYVIQSTPLIKNPSSYPSFYYVSLKGITVGTSRLHIPQSAFALSEDGTGGVIMDSGTSFTVLSDVAYELVKAAFISQVKLPVSNDSITYLDLCFSLPSSDSKILEVPKFIFHFDGADLELPKEDYIYEDHSNGVMCLVMASSGGTNTIIGNYQQQNIHILYDLEKERLSFVPVECDRI